MWDLDQPISTEKALELLTEQQRRQILHRVAETPGGTTVDQLTKPVAAGSTNPGGSGSVEHRGIALHHVHLPKLHEAGVIEYDTSQGTVHRGRQFQAVLSLLQAIDEHREDASTGIS